MWNECQSRYSLVLIFNIFSQSRNSHLFLVSNSSPYNPSRIDIRIILLSIAELFLFDINPIERFWKELKKKLRWQLFDDLEDLRETLKQEINKLTPELIISVTGWQFILEAVSVANI